MDNLINVNREMAYALRSLALAGPKPVSEYVNVAAALSKLGIECHNAEGELLIDSRDALALADYIDRPVGDSGFTRQARLDIAMSLRYAVSDAVSRKYRTVILWTDEACWTFATLPRLSAWT